MVAASEEVMSLPRHCGFNLGLGNRCGFYFVHIVGIVFLPMGKGVHQALLLEPFTLKTVPSLMSCPA